MDDYLKVYSRRALFWAKFLARLPGVSSVFLAGSLSQGRASGKSDIDFIIMTNRDRIFTARFWTLIFLYLSNRLAHGKKNHAGKICPNHFISISNYEFQEKGKYYAFLLANLKFLAGDINVWELFKKSNRDWVKQYGYDLEDQAIALPFVKQKNLSIIGNYFEIFVFKVQKIKLGLASDPLPPYARVWLKSDEIRMHPDAYYNPDHKE